MLLGIVLLSALERRGVGQELTLTVEWVKFDCSSRPDLYEHYKSVFSNRGSKLTKAELIARETCLEYLRGTAPIQLAVRGVYRVENGKRLRTSKEINHHRLSVDVLVSDPDNNAYPVEIRQEVTVVDTKNVVGLSGASQYSLRQLMSPGKTLVGGISTTGPSPKQIAVWFTTLNEAKKKNL